MPGNALNLTLPTIGQTLWGGALNTILQTIIDDIEARITPDEIEVNQNLDFDGYQPTDVGGVGFRNASSGDPRRLFFSGNELWVTDGYGNHIKLTTTGTINISTVGQITGLAGSGASISYSTGDTRFTFLDQTLAGAEIEGGAVRLLKPGSTTIAAELRASSGMSADYILTFPSGSSARTQLVTFVPDGANASLVPSREVQVDTMRAAISGSFARMESEVLVAIGTIDVRATGSVSVKGGLRLSGNTQSGSLATFFDQGKWTPTMYLGNSTLQTGTLTWGHYQRMGDWCHAQFNFIGLKLQPNSGQSLEINGLPFPWVGVTEGAQNQLNFPGVISTLTIFDGNISTPVCWVTGSTGGTTTIRVVEGFNKSRVDTWTYAHQESIDICGTVSYRCSGSI